MSTLTSHVRVRGLVPGLGDSADAEASTIDQGPGLIRELVNNGPDGLLVHRVIATDDGHTLGEPRIVEPGGRVIIDSRTKLASPGVANVVVHGPVKR